MTTKYFAKFQSPRAITRPKIIGPERHVNLICNSSLYTHMPKIKSISPSIATKNWWQLFYFGIMDMGNTICPGHYRPLSGRDIKMKYRYKFPKAFALKIIKFSLQPKRFSVAEHFQVTFSLGNKSFVWPDHVFSSCCYRQCVVWHTRYNVNVHYCVISYATLQLSFQERISTLTEEIKDDLLRRMCEKHPQFVFDVLIRSTQEQGWYHPDPRPANEPSPTWCRCTHCREMPTEAEKVCCDQAPQNCYHSLQ